MGGNEWNRWKLGLEEQRVRSVRARVWEELPLHLTPLAANSRPYFPTSTSRATVNVAKFMRIDCNWAATATRSCKFQPFSVSGHDLLLSSAQQPHNATLIPPSWPQLFITPRSFNPSNHTTLYTDMYARHTKQTVATGICSCYFESHTGKHREAMGSDASSGAGGPMDGIEGSDEDRLAWIDVTREEGR